MKTVIHVNQAVIRANTAKQRADPPLTVKTYRSNTYADCAEIVDETGRVVARVIHRPDRPLSCGARVWVETELEVRATTRRPSPS